MTHDLAILGHGIAAAAALHALHDSPLSIAVIAPSPANDNAGAPTRDPIGETLSPAANAILRDLGLWESFQRENHRPARATFSAWGTDRLGEVNAFRQLEGPGWHLDRARFEAWLWNSAAQRTRWTRHDGAVVRAARNDANDAWQLTLADGREIAARFLLDCTGRRCALAQKLTPRHRADQLIAACSFLPQVERDIEPTPGTLIESAPDGWWYSALVPDGRLVVAYFSDHDLLPPHLTRDAAGWRELVATSRYTPERITSAGFALIGPPQLVDASERWLERASGDAWAAAGDAAAAFDPLSSHGITSALWSGRKAALAARAFLAGDSSPLDNYADTLAAGVASYREQRQRIYALERRYAEREFWRRRQTVGPALRAGLSSSAIR